METTSQRSPRFLTAVSVVIVSILSACAAGQLPVAEKLDELTAVTITYSRTPIIMSTDTPFDRRVARDYVQIGVIEVNRMGSLQYYLWLGISDTVHMQSTDRHPGEYESIVFASGGEDIQFDVHGWTEATIGTSEPVYKKLFRTSLDAYYQVTLEQIRLLIEADRIGFRTTGSAPKEFIVLYKPTTAKESLREFLSVVSQ